MHPTSDDARPVTPRMQRGSVVRLGVLGLVVLLLLLAWVTGRVPEVDALREQVEGAGAWGPLVFVVGYAALALLPTPKGLMTALGAVLFGFVVGAVLAWAAAMLAALVAFGLSRLLGREAVDRIIGGRLDRVDALMREHGLVAVVAVRLVPVLPYTAINYAAGLVPVGLVAYLLGTAVGMVPGTVAYAALGAFGTSPGRLSLGLAVFVALAVVATLVGRRMLRHRPTDGPAERSRVGP